MKLLTFLGASLAATQALGEAVKRQSEFTDYLFVYVSDPHRNCQCNIYETIRPEKKALVNGSSRV